jgi:hypothetical protein
VGLPLYTTFFLIVLFGGFEHRFGERIEHAVAGAIADDEIISERCDVFDVEEQDVFTLFVLQGGDDFMCKFECVQISPHKVEVATFLTPSVRTGIVTLLCND